jgi:3-oxoacyl-[acyl-carrier protein] reductase
MSKEIPGYIAGHQLLAGKHILITAAAGAGIGFAAAKRAVEEGAASLVISDVHEGRLQQAVETLASINKQCAVRGIVADVTNQEQVQHLVDEAEQFSGGVDVLINNAGLGGTCRLEDMSDEAWHRVIDISLTGTMRMMRAMVRYMHPRGRGVIVNNASVLGWRAQTEQCHYAAAKAGVMALTRCAAMESAEFGLRINAVSPSIAMHDFLRKTTPPELLAELSAREAFGRPAEVWEVANVMMFLASDYASYMTGEVVSVSSQHP